MPLSRAARAERSERWRRRRSACRSCHGTGSGIRRRRCTRSASISVYAWRATAARLPASSRPVSSYIRSRQVQNESRPAPERCSVLPASARWNAWLWALVRPGITIPAMSAPAGGEGDARRDLDDLAVADAQQHILRPSVSEQGAARQDPFASAFSNFGTRYRRTRGPLGPPADRRAYRDDACGRPRSLRGDRRRGARDSGRGDRLGGAGGRTSLPTGRKRSVRSTGAGSRPP